MECDREGTEGQWDARVEIRMGLRVEEGGDMLKYRYQRDVSKERGAEGGGRWKMS